MQSDFNDTKKLKHSSSKVHSVNCYIKHLTVKAEVNFVLMIFFFSVPVCPHGGGVGLCEYIQHISIFDFICVSATLENRLVV